MLTNKILNASALHGRQDSTTEYMFFCYIIGSIWFILVQTAFFSPLYFAHSTFLFIFAGI